PCFLFEGSNVRRAIRLGRLDVLADGLFVAAWRDLGVGLVVGAAARFLFLALESVETTPVSSSSSSPTSSGRLAVEADIVAVTLRLLLDVGGFERWTASACSSSFSSNWKRLVEKELRDCVGAFSLLSVRFDRPRRALAWLS